MSFLSKIELKKTDGCKVEADAKYYIDQITSILSHAKDSEYLPAIQVRHEGKATKWLNVTVKNLEDLIASFKKHGGGTP